MHASAQPLHLEMWSVYTARLCDISQAVIKGTRGKDARAERTDSVPGFIGISGMFATVTSPVRLSRPGTTTFALGGRDSSFSQHAKGQQKQRLAHGADGRAL